MKGQKDKDLKTIKQYANDKRQFDNIPSNQNGQGLLRLTPLDLVPLVVTPDSFWRYLVNSGWLLGLVISSMNRTNNQNDIDEVYHEIILMLYDKMKKVVDVYENQGIMAALGYCKVVCVIQSIAGTGVDKKLKSKIPTIDIGDYINDIDNCYNPDVDEVYHLTDTTLRYPSYNLPVKEPKKKKNKKK